MDWEDVIKAYVGQTELDAIYIGDEKVWSKPKSTLLVASVYSDILSESKCEDYVLNSNTWDNCTVITNGNTSRNSDGSIRFPDINNYVDYNLGSANRNVTVYMVSQSNSSKMSRLITLLHADSTGNAPGFYQYYGELRTTYYSNDVNTGRNALNKNVMALSINGATRAVRYFVNGVYFEQKICSNSGAHAYFTATPGEYPDDTNVYFIGVVDGTESDATIISNMNNLKQYYGVTAT